MDWSTSAPMVLPLVGTLIGGAILIVADMVRERFRRRARVEALATKLFDERVRAYREISRALHSQEFTDSSEVLFGAINGNLPFVGNDVLRRLSLFLIEAQMDRRIENLCVLLARDGPEIVKLMRKDLGTDALDEKIAEIVSTALKPKKSILDWFKKDKGN